MFMREGDTSALFLHRCTLDPAGWKALRHFLTYEKLPRSLSNTPFFQCFGNDTNCIGSAIFRQSHESLGGKMKKVSTLGTRLLTKTRNRRTVSVTWSSCGVTRTNGNNPHRRCTRKLSSSTIPNYSSLSTIGKYFQRWKFLLG